MLNYTVADVQRLTNHIVVRLQPVDDHDQLDFLPGQYVAISFRRGNRWSPARCFSIVSSPKSSNLEIASRFKGRFTRKLANLEPGTSVKVQGPFGNFTVDPAVDRQIVMLAGGIGITPFMSMLRRAAETKLPNPITLVYACQRAADIPFRDELQALEQQLPRFRVIFVVRQGVSDQAERIYAGRIDDRLITQLTGQQSSDTTYFICGPNSFMGGMSNILRHSQVARERIVTEAFGQSSHFGWAMPRGIPLITYATTGLVLLAGFGLFTAIDLTRYLPKVRAAATSPTNTTATTPTDSSASTSSQATPATTSNTDTTTTPQASTQTYQAPVTSVS